MAKSKKPASAKQKAWRAKFASMYGGKKSRSTGGSHTTKGKGNGNGKRKQGITSWATSVVALIIGFGDVIARGTEAAAKPAAEKDRLGYFVRTLINDYTGLRFTDAKWTYDGWDPKAMIRGYAPIGAGIAFKKSTSYLVKTAKIQSIIPALRA